MKLFINIILEEEWKMIKYKNIHPLYEISNYGRIRNIKNGRILYCNKYENEGGYIRVKLKIDNERKKFSIHRLVLIHFNPINNPDDYEVNHKDGNKQNNRLDNLEWVTSSENMKHMVQLYSRFGENVNNSILLNEEVEQICQLMQKGYSNSEIVKNMDLKHIKYPKRILSSIRHSKAWNFIRDKYDIKYKDYKKYTKEEINKVCELLIKGYKNKDIIKIMNFDYSSKDFIKNIKMGRRHEKEMKEIYDRMFNDYPKVLTTQ